jgi:hypothetical protein
MVGMVCAGVDALQPMTGMIQALLGEMHVGDQMQVNGGPSHSEQSDASAKIRQDGELSNPEACQE